MAVKKDNFIWQTQTHDAKCETIDCFSLDPIKDFRRDPTGYYVLIRPDYAHKKIEVAMCDKKHVIVKVFRGSKASDIYESILRYEVKHRQKWFQLKGHVAYLGKELKMAELAIVSGRNDYCQE